MAPELLLLTRVSYQGKEIAGIRLHNLLALLADDLRSGCGTARLVRGLWPEQRPENPSKALQILVSRLRARLGQDAVVRTTTGYRLALREDQVDASVLLISTVASVRSAAAGDHANALVHAEAGLAVWDGVAEPDGVPEGPLASLRAERALVRRSLVRARALALSRLGHPGEAFEPLADIAAERRYDEEVLVELLRSEAATNGPAAALARYEAYRRALREELGTGPGDAVRAMHGLLLQHQTPRVWHGVPHDPNPLLGRADDIARVKDLLRSSRVVSIVGTGGLGKTRLAYAVSREAEQRTVHVVGLAGISSDEDVVNEVSSVLGVTEARRTPGPVVASVDALSGIINALGPGPALLVLDNCEHVIRGVAELVHALVARAPEVRVLTTSRAPLGLSSESVHRLPELDLSTAVELFRQRARAARPDVELSTDTIEELCRHLDGLPLAIELAAARVRALSVGEIARRLDDRFGLLSGGMRDAPSRHRTLHAVVDWSWNLLSPSGQAAMRTLSIFPGGFTVDAAQRVLGGDRTLDLLEDLVGQSLLKVTDTPTGIRFRMLETVREFSSDHQTAAEMDQMTNRFLAWAREFGVAHHDSLVSADPFSAVERVRAEQDNLVQALRHGLARSDGATVAATSAALAGLWTLDDDYARTVTLANETAWVLSHYRPKPEFVEATRVASALSTVNMFMLQGRRPLRSWVTLRRLPPAPPDSLIGAVATVLDALRSDFAGLESLCGSDEPLLAGIANGIASYLAESQGDSDHALRTARRMSDAMDGRGPPLIQIQAHSRVAELCLRLERGDEARQHLKVALRLLERSGPRSNAHQIQVWWALVLANLQSGAVEEAARWLGLAAQHSVEDVYGLRPFELGVRAEVTLARGDVDAGLREWRRALDQLMGKAHPLFEVESTGLTPWGLEMLATSVVAHARHGRLDLMADLVNELPDKLTAMLTPPGASRPTFVMEFPLSGALLLALSIVDLQRGRRADDRRTTASAVRMIALAERFDFLRNFPTMSAARARQIAEQADRSVYAEAVASYADLDREELRAAALTAVRARGASVPGPD